MAQFPGQNAPPGGHHLNSPDGSGSGVFATDVQGASPKYAQNNGYRADTQQRNTLARMLIRVDASEQALFSASVGDPQVRTKLLPRIAGDPISANAPLHGNGYVDFILEQVQMPLQENYQVVPTLADNYVAYFFGQAPPTWSFAGRLINSHQDDQASNMMRLYLELLRGTQLARRQKIVSLRFDSYTVAGAIVGYTPGLSSANELLVNFSFQMLVKRLYITNYTAGWNPTVTEGVFARDLNAVAYDGRPVGDARAAFTASQIPAGQVQTPTPQTQADPRTDQPPPPPNTSPNNALVSSAPTTDARNLTAPLASGVVPGTSVGPPPDASQNLRSVISNGRPETLTSTQPPNANVSTTSDVSGVSTDATAP